MDEKLLEKLDELIQELSCMNGNLESISENLEALAGCVDDDEGKPRLLIGGYVEKYDWMAVQNARSVRRCMEREAGKYAQEHGRHGQGQKSRGKRERLHRFRFHDRFRTTCKAFGCSQAGQGSSCGFLGIVVQAVQG